MRSLAEYVMRGRQQAILMVLLFSILPLFSWVADVIVVLVTLRKGTKEGSIVLLWSILPVLVLAWHYPAVLLYRVLAGTVLVYCMGIILRKTSSWIMVLYVMALTGIIGVTGTHIAEPAIADLWQEQLLANFTVLQSQIDFAISSDTLKLMAKSLAKIATGIQVSFILIANLITLIFARWWQALLYNPPGLSAEIKNIRVTLPGVIMLAVVTLAATTSSSLALDILPVAILPFLIAGLSLLHAIVAITQASKFWLFVFYSFWLVLFPYLTCLLVLSTLADYWWNFRQRLQSKKD